VADETRWLSAAEQADWRAFIAADRLLFEALEQQMQREHGMPVTYYEILVELSEAPGRALRMSQLAAGTTSSRSRLSHAVARLERQGWVRRRDCPTDRRGQVAELTDAGFAALQEAAPGHVETVRTHLLDVLGPDKFEALGEISRAIVEHFGGAQEPEPGC
jgi:DNA-binding MarR family transcriptional regulator